MIEALKSDEIVNKVGGRFKLTALIQKRMVELMDGARPLVERGNMTDLEIVVQEILQDKIAIDYAASGLDVVLSGFFSSTRIFPNHTVDPERKKLAEAALAQLGVSHLAERAVAEMSSGEAKRVLIARALVHKPRALLFDEPCNSLDILAQHGLRETMRSLANSGIGIILVTHELPDVVPEIERVVLMSNGRIVADGRKEDVLQANSLGKLFGLKVELGRREGYYHIW